MFLSINDHGHKIKEREQRTDVGKHSFVNRLIRYWNALPTKVLETFPKNTRVLSNKIRNIEKCGGIC